MAEVTVDQGRLEALQNADRLLAALLDDPKYGLPTKRAIKEKFPTARLPELDIIAQATGPIDERLAASDARYAALEKAFNDFKGAAEQTSAETKLKDELDRIRRDYSLTDEGMAGVVEVMRTEGLAHNPAAAAALYQVRQPKPKPMSTRESISAPRVDMFGLTSRDQDKRWDQLHAKPWDFFDDQVAAVLDEFRDAA